MPDIYRDPSDGAAARRDHLLRRRRDELATLPHAVRRVVVARSARIGASLAVALLGATLVGLASWPAATSYLGAHLPNHPAVLTAMLCATWLGGVFAWWVARARCEHRFAVAMSRFVLPGADVASDVERLDHEHVDEQARAMAQRLEIRSAALPVLASALVVPATAVYLAAVVSAGGVPTLTSVEGGLADAAGWLALLGVAGGIAALLVSRPALRSRKAAVLGIGLVPAATIYAAIAADEGAMTLAWTLVGAIAIAAAIGTASWRLVRERVALDATDPAAGSEVITVRAVVRQLVAAVRAVARRARATSRRTRVTSACALASIASFVGLMEMHGSHAAVATATASSQPASVVAHTLPDADDYRVERRLDGDALVTITGSGQPVTVTPFDDMLEVPHGWHATLTVTSYAHPAAPDRFEACESQPLAFTVSQPVGSQLLVHARLEPGPCSTRD
jgi:hypothetical protein